MVRSCSNLRNVSSVLPSLLRGFIFIPIFALAIKDGRMCRGKPPKGRDCADMPNTWAGGLEADG